MSDVSICLDTIRCPHEADCDCGVEDRPAATTAGHDRLPRPARHFHITDLQQWIDLCA